MPQSPRIELPPGQVLTVTADGFSSGTVRRIAPSGDATQYAAATVAVGTGVTVGPFAHARNYEVLSASGALTYALSDGETQAYDADLTTWAGATPSAYFLTIVPAADAGAMRSTLGLGTIATQAANAVGLTGGTINGVVIGGTTPATAAFTAITVPSITSLTVVQTAAGYTSYHIDTTLGGAGGSLKFTSSGVPLGSIYVDSSSTTHLQAGAGEVDVVTYSSSTFNLASGVAFQFGAAAATAIAVASTHKIAVKDATGTTYYLLATT